MATVFLSPDLRDLAGGPTKVRVPGQTVREVVDELDLQFPGIRDRLCIGVYFKPSQTVAVDDIAYTNRVAMYQEVGPESEVHFITAISGG